MTAILAFLCDIWTACDLSLDAETVRRKRSC